MRAPLLCSSTVHIALPHSKSFIASAGCAVRLKLVTGTNCGDSVCVLDLLAGLSKSWYDIFGRPCIFVFCLVREVAHNYRAPKGSEIALCEEDSSGKEGYECDH